LSNTTKVKRIPPANHRILLNFFTSLGLGSDGFISWFSEEVFDNSGFSGIKARYVFLGLKLQKLSSSPILVNDTLPKIIILCNTKLTLRELEFLFAIQL
jgi:hypothetical protein